MGLQEYGEHQNIGNIYTSASSGKDSLEAQMAVGRELVIIPIVPVLGEMEITAGNQDLGQMLQSWITVTHGSKKSLHKQHGSE